MSINKEYEERTMLTEDEFHLILESYTHLYPHHHFTIQTNHYFDTLNNDLHKTDIVLRLREIKGKGFELTLKVKNRHFATEITDHLLNKDALECLKDGLFPNGEVKEALKSMNIDYSLLKYRGQLTTKRFECYEEYHLVVIDENYYFNLTDYNLEVEAANEKEAKKIINYLIKKYHLSKKEKCKTKSTRFFENISQ